MPSVAVPVRTSGITTSVELALFMVIVSVFVVPSSKESAAAVIEVTVGVSSLSKFNVTSVTDVVPFVSVPIVNIIVSITSISVSCSAAVIDTVPVSEPAAIVIEAALTEYSPDPAVPERVKGIVISCPETGVAVAVRVMVVLDPSTIVDEDKAIVTTAGSSLSVMVSVTAVASDKVALAAVPGVTIIVSLASSVVSFNDAKVTVAVVAPAAILNSGFCW